MYNLVSTVHCKSFIFSLYLNTFLEVLNTACCIDMGSHQVNPLDCKCSTVWQNSFMRPHSQKRAYLLILLQSFSTISQVYANKPCDLPFITKTRKSVHICVLLVLPEDRQAVIKGMQCKAEPTQLSPIYNSYTCLHAQKLPKSFQVLQNPGMEHFHTRTQLQPCNWKCFFSAAHVAKGTHLWSNPSGKADWETQIHNLTLHYSFQYATHSVNLMCCPLLFMGSEDSQQHVDRLLKKQMPNLLICIIFFYITILFITPGTGQSKKIVFYLTVQSPCILQFPDCAEGSLTILP